VFQVCIVVRGGGVKLSHAGEGQGGNALWFSYNGDYFAGGKHFQGGRAPEFYPIDYMVLKSIKPNFFTAISHFRQIHDRLTKLASIDYCVLLTVHTKLCIPNCAYQTVHTKLCIPNSA